MKGKQNYKRKNCNLYKFLKWIPVDMLSETQVCSRLRGGIVGSNSGEFIDVCVLCSLCVVRVGASATS
jgi:hypothetical protein